MIKLLDSIEMQTNLPLDKNAVVKTLELRNSISPTVRYIGMEVYVSDENKKYRLENGIENFNWTEIKAVAKASELVTDNEHQVVSQSEKDKWNNKAEVNHIHKLSECSIDNEHMTVTKVEKESWNNKSDSNHNHNASEIVEDDNHKFLTSEDAENLSNVKELFNTVTYNADEYSTFSNGEKTLSIKLVNAKPLPNFPELKFSQGYGLNYWETTEYKEMKEGIIRNNITFDAVSKTEPDYYFLSMEDFNNRRDQILTENNNDLSSKTLQFNRSIKKIDSLFENTNIRKTPKAIISVATSAYKAFNGCSSLVSISPTLFKQSPYIKEYGDCFKSTAITEIPEELFIPDISLMALNEKTFKFNYTFAYCYELTTVPKNLFKGLDIENASGTFQYCHSITSEIPGLNSNEPENNKISLAKFSERYAHMCYSAANWESLDPKYSGKDDSVILFNNAEDFNARINTIVDENNKELKGKNIVFKNGLENEQIFFDSSLQLKSLPDSIFAHKCTNASQMFSKKVGEQEFVYTDVPTYLISNMHNLTNVSKMFENVTSIKTVSAGTNKFFHNNKKIQDVSYVFNGCTNITYIPKSIIDINESAVSTNAVNGCNNAINYLEMPSRFRPETNLHKVEFTTNGHRPEEDVIFYIEHGSVLPDRPILHFNNVTKQFETISWSDNSGSFDIKAPINQDIKVNVTFNVKTLFHYDTPEEFEEEIFTLSALSNGDLSQVDIEFGENITETKNEKVWMFFPNITKTPNKIISQHLTNVSELFADQGDIVYISKDLFVDCPNITNFSKCFYRMNRYFSSDPNLDHTRVMVPEGLFRNNKLATDFNHCFASSYNLTSVPFNLLDNCPLLENVSYMFMYCINLTSKLPDVWNKAKFPNLPVAYNQINIDTYYEKCYKYAYEATNALNYHEVPANYCLQWG